MPRWVESWEVESRSKPGEYYVVSRDEEGNFGCSCLAWTRQRKECKHIRLMKGQLSLEGDARASVLSGMSPIATRVAKSSPSIVEEPAKKRRRFVLD